MITQTRQRILARRARSRGLVLVCAVQWLPLVTFSLPGGVLADRVPRPGADGREQRSAQDRVLESPQLGTPIGLALLDGPGPEHRDEIGVVAIPLLDPGPGHRGELLGAVHL